MAEVIDCSCPQKTCHFDLIGVKLEYKFYTNIKIIFMKKLFHIGFLAVAIFLATVVVTMAQSSTPSPTTIKFKNTVSSSAISMNSARLTAEIQSGTGITERGFQYDTNLSYTSPKLVKTIGSYTTGPYSQTLTNLSPKTRYFFRGYAKNSSGTVYSISGSFETTSSDGSLSGWAWSSNIGWVSFNCADADVCPASDYKVRIDLATGLLSGFAWSSNVGWIKFDGLSDYPSSGTAAVPAKINMTNGNGEGWIRACAGTVNGDCSTMTSRTDGWDGWIELSGTKHSANAIPTPTPSPIAYTGVRMNTGTGDITGMAWGGEVVGWLNFDANATTGFSASCSATDIDNNTIRFTANATGGHGLYEYKWDNSPSYTSNYTFDKTYPLGSKDQVVATLVVRKKNTNLTFSPSCVGTPASLPPISITKDPKCKITSPAPDASGNVSIITGKSVTFNVEDPEPSAGADFRYIYYPSGNSPITKTEKTYTHTYNNPTNVLASVQVVDNNNIYPSSDKYSCGTVEVKDPILNLQIKEGDSSGSGWTDSIRVKKGRNVSLKWENSLQTDPSIPGEYYDCVAVPPPTTGNEWMNFANAEVNKKEGTISGLSTQKTGKHIFEISCEHFPYNPSLDMSARAILNVVSTSGSEI